MSNGVGILIDPRLHPDPPCRAPERPLADSKDGIAGLIEHCRNGRVYATEQWIADGKPLQATVKKPQGCWSTAMSAAIETRQHDIVHLLLCNGYRLELEKRCSFDRALALRARSIINLLFSWGADASKAQAYEVINTYDGSIIERFWRSGLDLWTNPDVLYALGGTPSIRQLYGVAKRLGQESPQIQRALDIGLGQAVEDRKDRAIALCLWAGANPHRPVPRTKDMDRSEPWEQSAVTRAVWCNDAQRLAKLKPDPHLDNFDDLYAFARSTQVIDVLSAIALPQNWSAVIRQHLEWITFHEDLYGYRAGIEIIDRLFSLGGRLSSMDTDQIRSFRRGRKRASTITMIKIVKRLRDPRYCDPDIFSCLFGESRIWRQYQEKHQVNREGDQRPGRRPRLPPRCRPNLAGHCPPNQRSRSPGDCRQSSVDPGRRPE